MNGMTDSGKTERIQENVRRFWDAKPCDSELSAASVYTRAFYAEIEQKRYVLQPHILGNLEWVEWHRQRVLEIGTGVGTDARQLVARGAIYRGMNVDVGSTEATARALSVFDLDGEVTQASATAIPAADGEFDVVYSFGVLHHIPDVSSAIAEIHRVLRPGGQLLIMLYNRNSINYRVEIMVLRKLGLRILALPGVLMLAGITGLPKEKLARHLARFRQSHLVSDEEWLSRNTDGPDNPYSRVYDAKEVRQLLGDRFVLKRSEIRFFDARHWGVFGRLLPQWVVRWLGRRWGWHRIVLAVKQAEPVPGASDG